MSRLPEPFVQAEVGAAETMIERAEERFDLKPQSLAADTACGTAETLNWVVNEKRIAPHIPVKDMSRREDGSLSREDFIFDKARNVYICPQGSCCTRRATFTMGRHCFIAQGSRTVVLAR
jgi:hypothetical protein